MSPLKQQVPNSEETRPFKWHKSLYLQVLLGVVLGIVVGVAAPRFGSSLKPVGDAFVRLVKMLIAPIVFTTVVTGIAKVGDLKQVGRVGLKTFVYFEVVTTFALAIGLIVGTVAAPGRDLHVDVSTLNSHELDNYTHAERAHGPADFFLNIIPNTIVDAFAKGEILSVLLIAILFGAAVSGLGEKRASIVSACDQLNAVFFRMVGIVMRVAPIGAFGAMAFTVGKYGLHTLASLGKLVATFYLTSTLFVVLVLGLILRVCGVRLWHFLRYLREEILIVLGTSSSESALPGLMRKLEAIGCRESTVGLVVPMGYSFNLDGTSIYLTLATLFVAQATDTHLTFAQQLSILLVLLLTSKGAAAVTGGGFITLAATLSATGEIPVAGLVLLLGVDRFMSEARAITNLIGNGVATIAISRWERELDVPRANMILSAPRTAAPTAS
ncbi:MAG: C4-dicarboxylate transporter DctA [Sandaracinaceae bacterium]|nr:C4-dicarboxylate transporter DctA [Sandaracinaceae bacterium]